MIEDICGDALEYLAQGGWIMAPLILCSLVMWTLIGERLHFFRSLTRRDVPIEDAIRSVTEKDPHPVDTVRGLRERVVDAFLRERTGTAELDRSILHHCALKLQPLLHRYLAVIAVLAAVAPLLGLLGTVIGMVDTFQVISAHGTGNVKGLSGGISVALITTQSGLLVAIPGLFLSGYLHRRAARQELRLEEITAVLERYV